MSDSLPSEKASGCGSPTSDTQRNLAKRGRQVQEEQEVPGWRRWMLRGQKWAPVSESPSAISLAPTWACAGREPQTARFAGASRAELRHAAWRLGCSWPGSRGAEPQDQARRVLGHLCPERRGGPRLPRGVTDSGHAKEMRGPWPSPESVTL